MAPRTPFVRNYGQQGPRVVYGVVENDKDQYKAGCVQVRCPEHGDIPRDKLPWTAPRGGEGPNHQKVGSFINYPPGTKLQLLVHDGPSGLVMTNLGPGQPSAGQGQEGTSVGGRMQVDISKSSLPTPARGGEENDVNFYLTDIPSDDPNSANPSDPKSETV